MAKTAPSFEDLDEIGTPNDNGSDAPEEIKLSPGDTLLGEIVMMEPDSGQFNNLRILLETENGIRQYWCSDTVEKKLLNADLSHGDTVGIKKANEPYEFTNSEGETVEAYDFEVRS